MLDLYRNSTEKKSNYKLIQYYLATFIAEVAAIAQENIFAGSLHPVWFEFIKMVNRQFKISRKVTNYANLLHLSPNHLNKIIKAETGKPASEIINQICVLEAKVLLVQTQLDISEIATELGFEDISYFSRFFRRYAGVSPREYRQMIDLS